MKKSGITLLIVAIICVTAAFATGKSEKNAEYLRIHIRANSNSEIDQSIKYDVKSLTVEFLTPYMQNVSSKSDAINVLNSVKGDLKNKIDGLLAKKGFNYKSNVLIKNEEFPTRVYEDLTLEKGYYDAVIVNLGDATGDNWWCVVYPPLCFLNDESDVLYKSKIVETIEDFKKRRA